ncbi:MAG: hypothetical protein AAFV88_10455 [Planctomycetota bacterium]
MCGIVAINAVALVVGIFHWPLLQVCLFEAPVGLLIAGAMFLPRKHLMEKLFARYKARAASLGAGGIALVGAAIIGRIVLRSMRRGGGGLDSSTVIGMIAFFFVFWGVVIGFAFLWKRFGVFRVLGVAYLAQMCFMTFGMSLTGVVEAKRDADRDTKMSAFQEESEQMAEEALERARQGLPPQGMPGGGNPRSGNRGPSLRGNSGNRMAESRSRMAEREASGVGPGEALILFTNRPASVGLTFANALLSKVNASKNEIVGSGSTTKLYLQSSASLQEIADAIDFGKVESIDQDRRIIRVTP